MTARLRRVGRTRAIVPLNVLNKSKARLSPILAPVERERLTVAMLKDVLKALSKAKRIHSVTVVSADMSARNMCRRYGASFLWEGKRRGLNRGVGLAAGNVQRKGTSSILIIHSDLPLLKPKEIDLFLKQSEGYSVALTPSKDRDGTNALFMNPPQVLSPVFGRDSFQRHLSLARKHKIRARVLRFRGIGFDIDTPSDLVELMHLPLRNETGQFLRTLREEKFKLRY